MSFPIDRYLPGWMRLTPYVHWLKIAQVAKTVFDVLVEGVTIGRQAAQPGQSDAPDYGGFVSIDALPLVGKDRRIPEGLDEEPFDYARRLRSWLVSHRRCGVGPWILSEVAAMFPTPHLMRLVMPGGYWWTRALDGSFTFNTPNGTGFSLEASGVIPDGGGPIEAGVAHGWNWGSGVKNALYLIIYGPVAGFIEELPPIGSAELAALGMIGDGTWTIGSTATPNVVAKIRACALQWRACGVLLERIIVSFDPDAFDPLAPALTAGYPDDGDWAAGFKYELDGDGDLVMVPVRKTQAVYWIGKEAEEMPV